MRALFCVPSPHDQSLPPLSATEDSPGLQWTENGELHGGWWVVGNTPQGNTMLVVVDTTPAMIEQMAADPKYLFLEEILDEGGVAKLTKPDKVKAETFIKEKSKKNVKKKETESITLYVALAHGVTEDELRANGLL